MNHKLTLTIALIWFSILSVCGQQSYSGIIKDSETNNPIVNATITVVPTGMQTNTDSAGFFKILAEPEINSFIITFLGYHTKEIKINKINTLISMDILLVKKQLYIDPIDINTGYYRIPKERATGSFVFLDSVDIHRISGSNILERLEGIAPGVQFINPNGQTSSDIRIRGLSTIESDETPLIVLDNFPYEGDINTIDPNEIESITILKDAAAASIWGAKAGNGVIVLTSKQGKRDKSIKANFIANRWTSDKLDLFYNPKWLPSETIMEIEKERYNLGQYTFADNIAVPYYIEVLEAHRKGLLDDNMLRIEEARLRNEDVRNQVMNYLYQNPINDQVTFNVTGGSSQYDFFVSAGHQNNRGHEVGEKNQRTNLRFSNSFSPRKWINIRAEIAYNHQESNGNGLGYNAINESRFGISPYLSLINSEKEHFSIPKTISYQYAQNSLENNLLDWEYRPLDELKLNNKLFTAQEIRLNTSTEFMPIDGLKIVLFYNRVQSTNNQKTIYHKDSFYVRDLVNSFTQSSGDQIIPHNAILSYRGAEESINQSGRFQAQYNKDFNDRHNITTLLGMELHEGIIFGIPGSTLYNYSTEYLTGSALFNYNEVYNKLPNGRGRIPGPVSTRSYRVQNRNLSYYLNANHQYLQRFNLSLSMRWDGSNLFGVKTNQKGVPLWSTGASWDLHKENFISESIFIEKLSLRGTFGITGNVNKNVTHHPVMVLHNTNNASTFDYATLSSIGNPSLRWEQVKTTNFAVEWSVIQGKFSGNLEYFIKKGSDLIGDDFLDPTTGILDLSSGTPVPGVYKINYASIKTKGWDLNINLINEIGKVQFHTKAFSSWTTNKIEHFNTNINVMGSNFFKTISPPIIGVSRDAVYSIPWHGLRSDNGMPILYMDGILSSDYLNYMSQSLYIDSLVMVGSHIPTNYGSIRNNIFWNKFQLGMMFTWKAGYFYRRSSMSTFDEYLGNYHEDYFLRWEQPGDEQSTNVPARLPFNQQSTYGQIQSMYNYSAALIEPGDHVRLQDLTLAYKWLVRLRSKEGHVDIGIQMRNVGLIWKKSRNRLDPDYPNANFKIPRNYSINVKFGF